MHLGLPVLIFSCSFLPLSVKTVICRSGHTCWLFANGYPRLDPRCQVRLLATLCVKYTTLYACWVGGCIDVRVFIDCMDCAKCACACVFIVGIDRANVRARGVCVCTFRCVWRSAQTQVACSTGSFVFRIFFPIVRPSSPRRCIPSMFNAGRVRLSWQLLPSFCARELTLPTTELLAIVRCLEE